jgi:hypothetical protein
MGQNVTPPLAKFNFISFKPQKKTLPKPKTTIKCAHLVLRGGSNCFHPKLLKFKEKFRASRGNTPLCV